MRIFAAWDIPAELRNELVQLLNEFFSAHPGCKLEIFMENTPTVTPAAFLAEPAAPVAHTMVHLDHNSARWSAP